MQYEATFTYTDVTGIGKEEGVCRRDPSDIIKVGGTYYLWYSRTTRRRQLYPSGYNATVWYATSEDEGRNWVEQGEAVGLGGSDAFDSFGVFTPNILIAEGKYYLFYTAVANGFTNEGCSDAGRTAIGVAVSDSPEGPWTKSPNNPVLESTTDPAKFDSFRVDDTCFVVRGGKYWLYYKGRQWENTPRNTKMGVAVADRAEGPYRRRNNGEHVQDSGHEVLVWSFGTGVMSLVSNTGPKKMTLQYADDGLDFRVVGKLPRNYPKAPGAFRPDLTDPSVAGEGITWGIGMATYGGDPYLRRYEIRVTPSGPPQAKREVVLPSKEQFHLFLLAGQSNMAGRGEIEAQDRVAHPRVLTLNKEGEWMPAVDPIHFDKPGMAGVCLGRTFGITLAEADPTVTIGLIPCAAGGSPITSWEPGKDWHQTMSHPYDDALARTKLAMRSGTLKGILWHQGESDSNEKAAPLYQERLDQLIARFRDELGCPNVPFIAGQLGQFPERPWDESRKQVDGAQRSLPDRVSHTAFVSSEGLVHRGDRTHFDSASLREFGRRYAAAYLKLVGAPPAE